MWKIISAILLTHALSAYYTNKQASDCVEKVSKDTCQTPIQSCVDDQNCKAEMANFQDCAFGTEQSIFNGYCFRKWAQTAVQTKQMIDCLVNECQLDYNSVIGIQELFECTQKAIVDNFIDCNEACLQELHSIRDEFYTEEIRFLFSSQLEDEAANKIVKIIRKQCIEEQYIADGPYIEQKGQTEDEKVQQNEGEL